MIRIAALTVGLALVSGAPDARADTQWWVQHLRQLECTNSGGGYSAEVSINGCNAIIRSNNSIGTVRADAYRHRGDRYRELGDLERALGDYNQAIRYNAELAPAYIRRADIYLAQGNLAGAESDYERVIELLPQSPTGYSGRCRVRAVAGQYDLARADCDAALELRPTHADSFANRGLISLRTGAYDAAYADFDAALANSRQPRYRYGRGVAALRLGRTEEGREDIADAVEDDAGVAEIFAREGVIP